LACFSIMEELAREEFEEVPIKCADISLDLRADRPCFAGSAIAAEATAHSVHNIGTELPVWTVLPFAGILLSIALCPLLVPHFWHNHFGKISAFWALLFAVPFLFTYHNVALHHILHIYLIDYIPFIILLWVCSR